MSVFLTILNLTLVIIGLATVVRYLVWQITDYKQNDFHYIVLLRDSDAEMSLRSILERLKYDASNKNRRIYAVDMGMDEQTADVCKLMSLDHSQIIYCLPEQLEKLL